MFIVDLVIAMFESVLTPTGVKLFIAGALLLQLV